MCGGLKAPACLPPPVPLGDGVMGREVVRLDTARLAS